MKTERSTMGRLRQTLLKAAALGVCLSACSPSGSSSRETANCVDLSRHLAERLQQQSPVSSLPHDVREQLMESFSAPGKICLVAPTVGVTCNAGGARAAEIRRCCKFAQAPDAVISGAPQQIRIRRDTDPESPLVVDLELRGSIGDLALDQRCEVPTCNADRAAGHPHIDVEGRLVADDRTVEIRVRIDLEDEVELVCELPQTEDGTS